ncbi:16250_t:CDS:2, partial [Racocetra persica]
MIGFRPKSISKHSTAARVMSLHEGNTPSGGIVANSQSAGATGFDFVGNTFATLAADVIPDLVI